MENTVSVLNEDRWSSAHVVGVVQRDADVLGSCLEVRISKAPLPWKRTVARWNAASQSAACSRSRT